MKDAMDRSLPKLSGGNRDPNAQRDRIVSATIPKVDMGSSRMPPYVFVSKPRLDRAGVMTGRRGAYIVLWCPETGVVVYVGAILPEMRHVRRVCKFVSASDYASLRHVSKPDHDMVRITLSLLNMDVVLEDLEDGVDPDADPEGCASPTTQVASTSAGHDDNDDLSRRMYVSLPVGEVDAWQYEMDLSARTRVMVEVMRALRIARRTGRGRSRGIGSRCSGKIERLEKELGRAVGAFGSKRDLDSHVGLLFMVANGHFGRGPEWTPSQDDLALFVGAEVAVFRCRVERQMLNLGSRHPAGRAVAWMQDASGLFAVCPEVEPGLEFRIERVPEEAAPSSSHVLSWYASLHSGGVAPGRDAWFSTCWTNLMDSVAQRNVLLKFGRALFTMREAPDVLCGMLRSLMRLRMNPRRQFWLHVQPGADVRKEDPIDELKRLCLRLHKRLFSNAHYVRVSTDDGPLDLEDLHRSGPLCMQGLREVLRRRHLHHEERGQHSTAMLRCHGGVRAEHVIGYWDGVNHPKERGYAGWARAELRSVAITELKVRGKINKPTPPTACRSVLGRNIKITDENGCPYAHAGEDRLRMLLRQDPDTAASISEKQVDEIVSESRRLPLKACAMHFGLKAVARGVPSDTPGLVDFFPSAPHRFYHALRKLPGSRIVQDQKQQQHRQSAQDPGAHPSKKQRSSTIQTSPNPFHVALFPPRGEEEVIAK